MLSEKKLNNKYFLYSYWLQFIIKCNDFNRDKILIDLSEILEQMLKDKKIKIWFFLNKKQNILVKVECVRKYRHELLNLNKLKQKYKKIIIKIDTFEPEINQFGGDKGWMFAKKYFNKISLLAIENIKRKREKIEFVTIIIFDLLLRACGDAFEVWDVLQKLLIIRGIDPKYQEEDIRKYKSYHNINLLFNNPKNFYSQKIPNRKLIAEVIKMNTLLIHDLEKEKFSLMFSIRSILPYYIIFIFNIFSVFKSEQKEIIQLLSFFLNPGKYK
jgi:thiopeptide-type bacteriocin biosynthesis protein